MAIRSVFFLKDNKVTKDDLEFKWVSGLSLSQKQKNIDNFHETICAKYSITPDRILEVSTKSRLEIGNMLSSINLKFQIDDKEYFFESLYQSSKVFQDGMLGSIHHPEWIGLNSFEAKKQSKEIKLPLIEFRFDNKIFPLEPKTMFFDWLYINCVHKYNINFLIDKFTFFTDIEFNPQKMISTQAHALCKYKHLVEQNQVEDFLSNPIKYYERGK